MGAFFGNGRNLGDAAQASTGEVALENNRSRGPVSERSISLGYWSEKVGEYT